MSRERTCTSAQFGDEHAAHQCAAAVTVAVPSQRFFTLNVLVSVVMLPCFWNWWCIAVVATASLSNGWCRFSEPCAWPIPRPLCIALHGVHCNMHPLVPKMIALPQSPTHSPTYPLTYTPTHPLNHSLTLAPTQPLAHSSPAHSTLQAAKAVAPFENIIVGISNAEPVSLLNAVEDACAAGALGAKKAVHQVTPALRVPTLIVPLLCVRACVRACLRAVERTHHADHITRRRPHPPTRCIRFTHASISTEAIRISSTCRTFSRSTRANTAQLVRFDTSAVRGQFMCSHRA
jgi:hypothetical protein